MREFMKQNGVLVLVILILAAAGVWYFALRGQKEPNISQAFFIDEETGEEMVLSLDQYPPRPNPHGNSTKPTLVEAVKYTRDGGKTSVTAYYRKYTDGAKKELEAAFAREHRPVGIDVTRGTLVRSPVKGSLWVAWDDPAATSFETIPNDADKYLPQ